MLSEAIAITGSSANGVTHYHYSKEMSHDATVWVSCRTSFFFFSSRRRHTRFDCDWSSDVCSSDLADRPLLAQGKVRAVYGRANAGERQFRRRFDQRLTRRFVRRQSQRRFGQTLVSDRKSVV